MEKILKIGFVTPEMMVPDLGEACDMIFAGGLGILAGEIFRGLGEFGNTLLADKNIAIESVCVAPGFAYDWRPERKRVTYRCDKNNGNGNGCGNIFTLQRRLQTKYELDNKQLQVDVPCVRRGSSLAAFPRNKAFDVLYTSDREKRAIQHALLGFSAAAIFKHLNFYPDIVWLNEGHTAVVYPALMECGCFNNAKLVFTTHTPRIEGLECFFRELFPKMKIPQYYGQFFYRSSDNMIDMTLALLKLADLVNAVSREHEDVTKNMFPDFRDKIISVTNGCDRGLWMSDRVKALGENPSADSLWEAHLQDKQDFLDSFDLNWDPLDPVVMFGRRITWYKQQLPMLEPIIQAVCGERDRYYDCGQCGVLPGLELKVAAMGRAHEADNEGIRWMGVFQKWTESDFNGKFVYRPEYGFRLLKDMAVSNDLWLHCPWPFQEACGASSRRSFVNGNPSASTKSGGDMEFVESYNPVSDTGNGFYIDPYKPRVLYDNLKIFSDLYWAWREKGDRRWVEMRRRAFKTGKRLDTEIMLKKYTELFLFMLGW